MMRWRVALAAAVVAVLSAGTMSSGNARDAALVQTGAASPDAAVPRPAGSSARFPQARPGDVLAVRLGELHPTQGAIGHDQIHYRLGRWQADIRRPTWQADAAQQLAYLQNTVQKRFEEYCQAMGGASLHVPSVVVPGDAAASVRKLAGARLDDPGSFACKQAPGSLADDLKTVVIGWDGNLYLTDGHHTMSALHDVADGGAALPVWVRVAANYRHLGGADAFWQRLADEGRAWLRDGANRPILAQQLPRQLGMARAGAPDGLPDDPYRSLVYFARDIGYDNGGLPDFAEFMWADWLRGQLDLSAYRLGAPATPAQALAEAGLTKRLLPDGSRDSYPAAVRDAALLMGRLAPDAPVAAGHTASGLGQIVFQQGMAASAQVRRARSALSRLSRDDVSPSGAPRSGGRLWYAVNYRECGPMAAGTACWGY